MRYIADFSREEDSLEQHIRNQLTNKPLMGENMGKSYCRFHISIPQKI